jgi:hypothetical protein
MNIRVLNAAALALAMTLAPAATAAAELTLLISNALKTVIYLPQSARARNNPAPPGNCSSISSRPTRRA